MNVHPATLSRVLDESRQLWAGSDEAPAVREIAYRLASAIAVEDPDFDQRAFVLGCGYEWPAGATVAKAPKSGSEYALRRRADAVFHALDDLLDFGLTYGWDAICSVDGRGLREQAEQAAQEYRVAYRFEQEADDPNSRCDHCAHDWVYTGIAYGGDDPRWHGEGRCYCSKCGADGDA